MKKMKLTGRRFQWTALLMLLALSGLSIFAAKNPAMLRGGPARKGNGGAVSAMTTATSAASSVRDFFVLGAGDMNAIAAAPAQSGGSFILARSVVAAGGASSDGNANITGVIGQSATGVSVGGVYSIGGGFWGGAGAGSGCAPIVIGPPTLPEGQLGQPYNQTLTAAGGTTPYAFTTVGGGLPPNLTLSSSGVISGTSIQSGTFPITVKATDQNGCAGTRDYLLTITNCPRITLLPASLPPGKVGTPYSQTIFASGGTPPYSFTRTGDLPPGMSFSPAGILSGTPTAAGVYHFTLRATDQNGCMGEQPYSVTIDSNIVIAGLQFYSLAHPIRLLDTRAAAGPGACYRPNEKIPGGTSRTQPAWGVCNNLQIPANAAAITGNITTVQSGGGFLTLYPSEADRPRVANSNYGPNEILNNVFTVGLGAPDGAFKIYVTTDTDVVVDVTGYYAPVDIGGLYFHPLPHPVRLLETRVGPPAGCHKTGAPLPGGSETVQQATGDCDGVTIPANARAIVGNATTVNPQGRGSQYLTLFPADATRPTVASSNYQAGQIMNGPFTVGLSPAGAFRIYPTTQTDLVIDVSGYYSPDAADVNGTGLLYYPLPRPVRLLETRPNFNGCYTTGAELPGESTRTQPARGICDSLQIPADAAGIVGNATVVGPLAGGWLTFFPSDATKPSVAQSNYAAGQVFNRHFIVGLGAADGAFNIFTKSTTHLVVDLSGYFAP